MIFLGNIVGTRLTSFPRWFLRGISEINGQRLLELGFRHVQGPLDLIAKTVAPPDEAQPKCLLFLGSVQAAETLSSTLQFPAIVVAEKAVTSSQKVLSGFSKEILLFECNHIKMAMALILPFFDQTEKTYPNEISPLASISKKAVIGKGVRIGPGAVIQDHVQVGDDVWVGPSVTLEAHSIVGEKTILHAGAVVGHNCRVGSECEIHSNVTIGSDGFGFIPNPRSESLKIPQIGNVIIGNRVTIGAQCAIDRATIGSTIIGDGCKLDNLCHIGHNCRLGPHGLYAAGFMVAGSSEIGSHFMCGGGCVVTDHVRIASHVMLGGRSGVTKDIEKSGAYTGYPLEPLKEGLRTIANLRELTRMRKDLSSLLKDRDQHSSNKGDPRDF